MEGRSLGADPDARMQTIAYEDVVRVTRLAVEEVASPCRVVNVCHPRVWRRRRLARRIRDRLGRGEVVFDEREGGTARSFAGVTVRMQSLFGTPEIEVQQLIDRVAADLLDE